MKSRDARPTLNWPRRDPKVPSFLFIYTPLRFIYFSVHQPLPLPPHACVCNAALRFPHLRVFEFHHFILQFLTSSFSVGVHLGFFVVWGLSSHVSSYGCSSLKLRKPPSHLCLPVGRLLFSLSSWTFPFLSRFLLISPLAFTQFVSFDVFGCNS